MRLICLNIWGGRAGREKLLGFFEKYNGKADIFCLQEVWGERYEHLEGKLAGGVSISNDNIMTYALGEIGEILPGYDAYFHPSYLQHYGLCTFVRKEIDVVEEGDIFVHLERGYIPPGDVGLHARNLQYITICEDGVEQTIMNFHGLWNGKGKGDCAERLEQSDRINEFVTSRNEPVILCGDFNLTPETASLKKIEDAGLRNLITEYSIPSTRTSLYTKPVPFADYAFVSPGITVNEFKILPDEVSDHAPLYLDFS